MKIVSTIANLIKKLFTGGGLAKIAKMLIGGTTTILTAKAAIDSLRVQSMTSTMQQTAETISGVDIMSETKINGTAVAKYHDNGMRKAEKYKLNEEDLAALAKIAESRNSAFQCLTPEEQFDILMAEKFDFDYYREVEFRAPKTYFRLPTLMELKQFGRKPMGVYRKKVNYGIFTPILRPLETLWFWLRDYGVTYEPEYPVDMFPEYRIAGDAPVEVYKLYTELADIAQTHGRRKYRKEFKRIMTELTGGNKIADRASALKMITDDDFGKKKKKKKKKKDGIEDHDGNRILSGKFSSYDDDYGDTKKKKKKDKDGESMDKDVARAVKRLYTHADYVYATGEQRYTPLSDIIDGRVKY